ncbi:MAG: hypothetical protein NTY37_12695 [Methanothrix sp.]|nr:hypothetical protein [Methanothrix sp.]
MKGRVSYGIAFCMLAMVTTGLSQSQDKPVFVDLIFDLDLPTNATSDQIQTAESNMMNIFNAATNTNLDWSLFLTKNTLLQSRVFLAAVLVSAPIDRTIEIGISGNLLDEKLSSKSYAEQKAILEDSKTYALACKVCGSNVVKIAGFKPQSFDQNEDTYKVLDEMGIEYNAGFQAGILYAPGHEKDVWPYKVENHEFYAVPVSTYMLSGELAPLDDRYAANKGISSSQWKDMLIGKFNEISGKDEPMVISLSTSISGSGEYLDALKQFRDFALSNNAKFVVTRDLVDMSRTGIHESSEGSSEKIAQNTSSDCAACDAAKNASSDVTISNKTAYNIEL